MAVLGWAPLPRVEVRERRLIGACVRACVTLSPNTNTVPRICFLFLLPGRYKKEGQEPSPAPSTTLLHACLLQPSTPYTIPPARGFQLISERGETDRSLLSPTASSFLPLSFHLPDDNRSDPARRPSRR
jgi:hypothetical protein